MEINARPEETEETVWRVRCDCARSSHLDIKRLDAPRMVAFEALDSETSAETQWAEALAVLSIKPLKCGGQR